MTGVEDFWSCNFHLKAGQGSCDSDASSIQAVYAWYDPGFWSLVVVKR